VTDLPDDDLDAVLEEIWRRLHRGAADKKSGFNAMYVGTKGERGWPETRTVILRRAEPSRRRLIYHSDRRAAKIAEIGADGRTSLLFWDPSAALQLRVWGQSYVLTDDPLAEEEWARSHEGSRAIYRVPQPPGRTLADPAEGDGERGDTDGRENFAVIPVTVMRFEWLHLRKGGHRRARFDAAGEGWHKRWIAP
jgi:hypothetical protein